LRSNWLLERGFQKTNRKETIDKEVKNKEVKDKEVKDKEVYDAGDLDENVVVKNGICVKYSFGTLIGNNADNKEVKIVKNVIEYSNLV
jgi:hypothetical protein